MIAVADGVVLVRSTAYSDMHGRPTSTIPTATIYEGSRVDGATPEQIDVTADHV